MKEIKIGKAIYQRVEHVEMSGRKTVTYAPDDISGLKITCSAAGMNVGGLVITSQGQLEVFAMLVSKAWPEAERLKPKIVASASMADAKPDPAV